jgi:phosphoinositide-3-kinase regulatory subunit 4
LRHFLKCDIATIDEQSLLSAMKTPVSHSLILDLNPLFDAFNQLSRQIFDAAVLWAMKGDKTGFWKNHRRSGTKIESPRESVISIRKTASVMTKNKTEELVLIYSIQS